MSRAWLVAAALLLCFGGSISVHPQQPAGSSAKRPTVFAPDDENRGFENAEPPSDLILDALLNTPEAKGPETHEALSKYDRESLRKLFQVVRVDLGDATEEDYIVEGTGPMTGADNIWFWIIRKRSNQAKVILFANCLSMELSRRQANGYRDIRSYWSSAAANLFTRVYHYDGETYKLVHEFHKQLKDTP